MAVGDVCNEIASVNAAAYLALTPAGTVEWVIHNLYHATDAELHYYDGANDILVDSHYGKGGWLGYFFHCNAAHYVRIKNSNTAAQIMGYDGIVTHA